MSGRKTKHPSKIAKRAEFMLDQDEIMKAMLAAGKGKGRMISDSEDSAASSDGEDLGGESSDEGSVSSASSSSTKHSIAQKHGISSPTTLSSDDEGGSSSRSLPSGSKKREESPAISKSLSRVKLPPPSTSFKPKLPSSSIDPVTTTRTSFESLGLSKPLISALATINIRHPTEIQSACISPMMSGRDVIGGAKTGSGKTLAFALPIVERIARDPFGVWAVILTPTRELAYQLSEQFLVVGRPLGLTTITVVGGMDMLQQAKELETRPHVVVATPGRLCDLLRSDGMSTGKLSRVKTLVLDEADRLLTPTFAPDLAYLFAQMPTKRQTCLFTATVSEAIMNLAKRPPTSGKQPPFVYRVKSDTLTVTNLKQKYLFIPSQVRDPYLYHLLLNPPSDIDTALRASPIKVKSVSESRKRKSRPKDEDEAQEPTVHIPSTIIFTQRCATAHLLHLLLNSLDLPSVPLHSRLSQPQRLLSLSRFKAGEVPILVTTDVGSRGLDIPEVAMVINWDCPRRSDDYVHRVGRTARAGRGGVAVTIVTERDVELVKMIEDEIGVRMAELTLPEETVLEKLNQVSLARRMATMEMHDSGFGDRQATNKAKQIKRQRRDRKAFGQ
ncbi:ATP-dependent RNA helicase DBP8 [Tremella mesenterica]|uniref:ATP-dependent RNA helicase DBP8 n=1 Tax=Tremella mesenterica TaxID=5217 RepID=A0A4Q1B8F6_TREME|nr:ATP-dependent RNA helicase DBP8 [Tremella mesenterica]